MHRLAILLVLGTCFAPDAHAEFGEYIGHELDGQTLVLNTDKGELRITALDDGAVEVHYLETGIQQLPSFAIAGDPPGIPVDVTDTAQSVTFATGDLRAIIAKSPVRIDYASGGAELFSEEQGYVSTDSGRGFRFRLDDGEKILGGGERVLGMDRRGFRMPLYNRAHYDYETESKQMYYGLSAVMSSDKYMIVFDNSASGWLDIGAAESDVLQFDSVGGRTSYIVVVGANYPALMESYTDVTGRQPLPPRWAFGNFASRFGYHTEKEARMVVRQFRRRKIPLDAIVLDIYWFGPDIQGHMGNLDWDRNAWPTAEDMVSDFAEDGVRTIAVTEPFILSTSSHWQDAVDSEVLATTSDGEPYRFDFYFGNTGLVDVFNETARQWFWQAYERLLEQGLAGHWGDLGEPEVHPGDALHWISDAGVQATGDEVHNAYGHVWTKMVYENQVAKYPDKRPMIMMRSGFAGTQRYGIVPWTGDVSRSWGGFKPQVELSLQMGLFGLGYTHSDLGGFTKGTPDNTVPFNKELYLRWLQYGVFQPVYRPHAQEGVPPEPIFHDRETRNIVRDYIELRYRLLPYNYTLAYENSTSGLPLMRPLFFEDESDPELIDEKDAYLWGDAFLVAPVTDPGIDSVNVPLPRGAWFDFWAGTRYDGGTTASIPVTRETIPVLVRAGSFIPMVDLVQSTDDYTSDSLALHYYADASVSRSSGQMYDDDGVSRLSLEQGEFELLKFAAQQDGDSLSIALRRDGGDYDGRPKVRDLEIVIHNWSAPVKTARFNGRTIRVAHSRRHNTLTARVDWDHSATKLEINPVEPAGKPVIYQVFTRLFGNKSTTNQPWGTIEENGVGKFEDFTDAALEGIRELGTTHIWYTGVPHHAVIRDYTAYGINDDDPDVVKGRAGSPYAIKDYYNVNPDLAVDPARRLEEFEALIERTHKHGMKVIIDIVPNHVARGYESLSRPEGVEDLGAKDDTTVAWARDNNFYYVVGEDFSVPEPEGDYVPLGGEPHPLADGQYAESPAKWTGNGSRAAQPAFGDWFETVKMNYGVRPDGSYAFDRLPDEAASWTVSQHAEFWRNKDVPDSWDKFRDIALYWAAKGVDGFRYDMAEMVPVEFWSFLNSSIKAVNPDALLLAEVYNPALYRDYIHLGRMDYLYDKVGLYDTLKPIMQGKESTDAIAPVQAKVLDIEEHMLHFLENHDEQRIASPDFAGDADKARPAMVVSALLSRSPTMLYFAQDVGEPGDDDAGFGDPTRTTIFDYWGVPSHQRWMNGGAFDGGQLTDDETELRDFYARILNLSRAPIFADGHYAALESGDDKVFAFTRWDFDEKFLIVSNFSAEDSFESLMALPPDIVSEWGLENGRYVIEEQLYGSNNSHLVIDKGTGTFSVSLAPLESVVYRIGRRDIHRFENVQSKFVSERHVDVWLPEGYEDSDEPYSVLYAHDGQNIFIPWQVGYHPVDWGIDEAVQRLIDEGAIRNTIVVGVWSTPNRVAEYLPWEAWKFAPDYRDAISQYMDDEPISREYLEFLVEELKPFIDQTYRTKPGREDTFLLGSSMGGLISLYGLVSYPDIFGGAACISTHWPSTMMIDNPEQNEPFLDFLRKSVPPPGEHRLYFDFGTAELDAQYEPHQRVVDEVMLELGYEPGALWQTRKFEGAGHNEPAWRERVHIPLTFLLGTDNYKE